MTRQLDVFISSKMVELAPERKMLHELLPGLGDDTHHLHAWVFEDAAPASGYPIRHVYLDALREAELYIGLFWNEYGEWTIDEFERATEWGIERHIYVKNVDAEKRDPRLQQFLDRESDVRFGVTPRWFNDLEELREQIGKSVAKWLLDRQIAHHSAVSAIVAEVADDVPEQPRRLIGRDDLVGEALHLLQDNEHVLLRGFGGMGKTAVAATIAADWIEAENDPLVWIKAGNADADALFEAIGRAFGEQQSIAAVQGDARLQAVRHLLAEKRALVLLDDVWNGNALAQMTKAIPRKQPLLVTSRQYFPLDEIIEIGQLSPGGALKLLGYHNRRADYEDDADAKLLCETLGYHAFALEIASKTLKTYQIAPAELSKRIEDAPHDLSMPANFGELGRTSVKSLLDASVDALDKTLHDTFLAFGGMFEATVTPELLALTLGQDSTSVAAALAELAQRGLVNERALKQIPYYRMHDLAYSYAHTMFRNKDLGHQAAIDACEAFASTHSDDLDVLDIEQGNILEAAEAAQQAGQDAALVRIMQALAVTGPYFAARGFSSHTLSLLRDAVEAAKAAGETESAHYLASKLGNAYADFIGDFDAALQTYQEARALAQEMNDTHREAILLTVIGTVRFRQGAADADDYHAQAEELARAKGDDEALCQILHNRAVQALQNSVNPDYESALRLSVEARQLAERLDLYHIQFWSLISQGACEHELGRYATALATHQTAYQLACAHDNNDWQAGALRAIGEDYHQLSERQKAQAAFDDALTLWKKFGAKAMTDELANYMQQHDYEIQ